MKLYDKKIKAVERFKCEKLVPSTYIRRERERQTERERFEILCL